MIELPEGIRPGIRYERQGDTDGDRVYKSMNWP